MTFAELKPLAPGFRVSCAIGPAVVLLKRLIAVPERIYSGNGDYKEEERFEPRVLVAHGREDRWLLSILWADEIHHLPKAPVMPQAEVEVLLAALLLTVEEDGGDPAVYLRGEAF